MRKTPTPKQLHTEALAQWQRLDDPDPRSALYLTADALVSADVDTEGTTGMRLPIKWAKKMRKYEDFWRATGKPPRENTRNRATLPGHERRHGDWARYQRRFEAGLSLYQAIRLDVSPAFIWDPWGDRWEANYRRCVDFVNRTGALPHLYYRDPEQFASARWLDRQLGSQQDGSLSEQRQRLIARLLIHAQQRRR